MPTLLASVASQVVSFEMWGAISDDDCYDAKFVITYWHHDSNSKVDMKTTQGSSCLPS